MRVYVAGPMRGLPHFGFPAFHAASEHLRAEGHEVFSPAEHDLAGGFDPSDMTGHEDLRDLGFDLRAALAADLEWITQRADAVFLLDGWQRSSGARAELAAAAALGLLARTFDNQEWVPASSFVEQLHGTPAPPPSGEVRLTSTTGGQKGSKLARFDLLPARSLWQIAEHFGRGATKYEARNWERGYDWSLSFAALQRHLWAWWGGEDVDAETGSSHLAAAGFHVLALLQFLDTHPGFDDRPSAEVSADRGVEGLVHHA